MAAQARASEKTVREPGRVLARDEVHVWQAELRILESPARKVEEVLDPEERVRAERFRLASARNEFVLGRVFLRFVLARYLGAEPEQIRFKLTAYGKPELLGSQQLRFNLSHSAGFAVVAVANRPVGVDVERIREDVEPMQLAERFFSKSESEWLRGQPTTSRVPAFFRCWTAKEAYVKARGEGLSLPLDCFAVLPQAPEARMRLKVHGSPKESRRWWVWSFEPCPGWSAAVAVEGEYYGLRFETCSFE